MIGTADRPGLSQAIRSSRWADEIVVVFDAAKPPRRLRGCVTVAEGPTGAWGHAQRNRGMVVASGTHLAFMDDDDRYTNEAGAAVRAAITAEPERVHVFCMRNRKTIISGPIEPGKISTQMFVVPREPVGTWSSRYEGDYDFISETMSLRGDDPVFHADVIAEYRPPLRPSLRARLGRIRSRTPLRRRDRGGEESVPASSQGEAEPEPDGTTIDP